MASIYNKPKTYLDIYNETIAPKLMELDLFLKEAELPITIWHVSQILDMPYCDVKTLMKKCNIYSINYSNIFYLILNGSSQICRLIQKEQLLGFPLYYTADDISYIYAIDKTMVEYAFKHLGYNKIESARISEVFSLLPV